MIKEVMTYKAGKFYFSSLFDRQKLNEYLVEARVLFRSVANIPILPNFAASLEEELIRRSIFGTAAIEGNPLSEDDVKKVLSEEEVSKRIKQEAEQQIINLKKIYEIIRNFGFHYDLPFLLSEEIIRDFHSKITMNCQIHNNVPGHYRNEMVQVGDLEHGGIYTPPKIYKDINSTVKSFNSSCLF